MKDVHDWISTHAIALATVEPNRGFADLEPLRRIIGTARILSLGEATHGSREFFQLKHRLLEFAVAELGFTIFAPILPNAFASTTMCWVAAAALPTCFPEPAFGLGTRRRYLP